MSAEPAKYVYGIVAEGGKLPAGGGIDDAPLEVVAADGIAAIVTDVLAGTGTTVSATAGQSFTAPVATFTDSNPSIPKLPLRITS